MVRLNLALSDQDMATIARVAEHSRLSPGTYARTVIVSAAVREWRRLVDSGEVEQYPQGDLFPNARKRKGGKG